LIFLCHKIEPSDMLHRKALKKIRQIHISNNQKKKTMKSKNFEQIESIFSDYALTCEEMICVKGGDGDAGEPIVVPNPPRIKI